MNIFAKKTVKYMYILSSNLNTVTQFLKFEF